MSRRFGRGLRPGETPGRNVARRVRPSPLRPCSAALAALFAALAALALLPAVALTAPVRAQPSAVGPVVLAASAASATFDGTWYDNAAARPFGVTAGSAGGGGPAAIAEVAIDGNRPNPFSERTTLRLGLPSAASVTVTLVDLLGREVVRVAAAPTDAGWHDVHARGACSWCGSRWPGRVRAQRTRRRGAPG